MKDLYIIGAGGFGRDVADIVRNINKTASVEYGATKSVEAPVNGPVYRIAGFIDDNKSIHGKVLNDIEVVGDVDWLRSFSDRVKNFCAIIAIGDPKPKRMIAQKLEGTVEWATIVHPLAIVSSYAEIGSGSIVQENARIGPNARIGRHCCIVHYSNIGHDAILGDHVSVMGHCDITGYDVLKDGTYVGTSVAIIPNVTVGRNASIGAGSVVIDDVPEGAQMFGYPARRIK
jgi:sugar O-acyltransferase (sialic acid O-acetyltransferase NeuD family)